MTAFKRSSETGKHVHNKILIYGPTHTAKTHAALTFPDPALVDVERRGAHFADRFDFYHAQPRTLDELLLVVGELKGGALACGTFIIDSYSVIYEKLVVAHTQTTVNNGKPTAVVDFVSVNRRIAPMREFVFWTGEQDLIVIAHAQQKFDRTGNTFTKRQGLEFLGDDKFRFAFDYIFRTEAIGKDPRIAPIKFHVEKSASPHLKIGDEIVVRPNERFYESFQARVKPGAPPAASGEKKAINPSTPMSTDLPPGDESAAIIEAAGPVSTTQLARIGELQSAARLNNGDLGVLILGVTSHRTQSKHDLSRSEADKLVGILEARAKVAAG